MPGFGHGFWSGVSRRHVFQTGATDDGIVHYGQSFAYHAGTDGTFFVDAVNGSDSNAGTSLGAAKATIGAAVTAALAAAGDQVVRVVGDGVKYRETINSVWGGGASSLKITGYGTDRPIISGANVLTGWVACTSGDEAVVGPNFASIYKVTKAKTDFPAPKYWRAIMAEAGEPLAICGIRQATRTTDDFFTDNINQCIDGAETTGLTFGLRDSTWYHTITHVGTLDAFSDAQLGQTTAVLHIFPNITGYMETASVSGGVITLTAQNVRPANGGANGAYALLNVLPTMEQGQWGYRDNGDGTVTFYCWPRNSANLLADMELSVRTRGLRIYRSASNRPCTVEGINFTMQCNDGLSATCLEFDGLTSLSGNTGVVRQCRFSNFSTVSALNLKFQRQAFTIENLTFQKGVGFGLSTAFTTSGGGEYLFGYRVRNCFAVDISQTGFRMFGVRQCVVSDVRSWRTSSGGHANAINFYAGCDQVAVINYNGGITLDTLLVDGYATMQASSRLYFLHCTFPPGTDSRAFVDQNISGATNPDPGPCALINCWVPHTPRTSGTLNNGGITVGRNTSPWLLYNNVSPAIVNTGGTLTRKGNMLTNSNTTADASEILADENDLHIGPANYNFTPKAGSILNSAAGQDVTAIIETLEGWFPDENFRRDGTGRAWNPAEPGVGPYGKRWA